MSADSARWIHRRWESGSRYYTAEVIEDLFGEWSLRCSWGALGGRKGNSRIRHMADYDTALTALDKLNKRRVKRGYRGV